MAKRDSLMKRVILQGRPIMHAGDTFMHVVVELPPGSDTKTVRKFRIPESTTAEEMIKLLAKRFKVEQGNWRLYGRDDGSTHIIEKKASLGEYRSDKGLGKARLYFYPEFRL